MDDQDDLGSIIIDVGDDLVDYGADNTLLQACIGGRRGPHRLEVGREVGERDRRNGLPRNAPVMSSNLGLDVGNGDERAVPTGLQFARDHPVRRVGGIVLPEGAIGRLARGLEIARERITDLVAPFADLGLRGRGGRNGGRADHVQESCLDRIIDTQAAERDASQLTAVEPAAPATVARNIVLGAGIA